MAAVENDQMLSPGGIFAALASLRVPIDQQGDGDKKQRQSPQRATLLVKAGGTAWLDCNVSSRSGPIYNHAVDRSRESGTFSVLG